MVVDNISNSISANKIGTLYGERNHQQQNMNRAVKSNENSFQHIRNEKEYIEEDIIDAIEDANKEFIVYDRRFEFSIHEKTKQIMVKIIDLNTNEIIREIPPEKILDMVACMWEIAGIIIDERI